ncbi:MAG: hypothetical protein U0263_39090 [Polyangiaceae bacterium]
MAPPPWVSPAGVAASVADVVSRHYVLALALASLALVAFAVAYLAIGRCPRWGSICQAGPERALDRLRLLVIATWVLRPDAAAKLPWSGSW